MEDGHEGSLQSCVLCKDNRTNTSLKELQCRHRCCITCIQKLVVESELSGGSFNCPECKHECHVPLEWEVEELQYEPVTIRNVDDVVSKLLKERAKKAEEGAKRAEEDAKRAEEDAKRAEEDFSEEAATINQIRKDLKSLKPEYSDFDTKLKYLRKQEQQITNDLKEIPTINKNKIKGSISEVEWRANRKKHVELLLKLGNIIRDIGKIDKEPMQFVKAIAVYECGIVQCSDELEDEVTMYNTAKRQALNLFFQHCIGKKAPESYFQDEKSNKTKLDTIRRDLKVKIQELDENRDCDCYEEKLGNDERIVQEKKRIKQIGDIFKWIHSEIKEFMSDLVKQCQDLLDFHPIDFALIAFGSFSRKETTPFSDVEFAAVQDSSQSEMEPEYREYLEKMIMILHLKLISFGETVLPAMAISSLNDNTDPSDKTKDWYLDLRSYVTVKQGISFDGLMQGANKTPYFVYPHNNKFRLINTKTAFFEMYPKMNKKELKALLYFFKGDFTTLFGNESLGAEMKEHFKADPTQWKVISDLIEKELEEDLVKYSCVKKMYNGKYERHMIEKDSFHIKKELYRLPSVVINNLLHLLKSDANCIWDVESLKRLTSEGVHHLKMVLSTAAELRLRGYVQINGQVDEEKGQLLPKLFVGKNIADAAAAKITEKAILRYFTTVIPLAHAIEKERPKGNALESLVEISLYNPSNLNHAIAYILMQKLDQAKKWVKAANDEYKYTNTTELIMQILCNVYIKDTDISKQFLDSLKTGVLQDKDIDALNTYGNACLQQGEIEDATEALEESVHEAKDARKITSLTLLATAYSERDDPTKYETFLKEHPEIKEIEDLRSALDEKKALLEEEIGKGQKQSVLINTLEEKLAECRNRRTQNAEKECDRLTRKVAELENDLAEEKKSHNIVTEEAENEARQYKSRIKSIGEQLSKSQNNFKKEKKQNQSIKNELVQSKKDMEEMTMKYKTE
ncbi:unnamed protein product, partial [Owenia fusiformis]